MKTFLYARAYIQHYHPPFNRPTGDGRKMLDRSYCGICYAVAGLIIVIWHGERIITFGYPITRCKLYGKFPDSPSEHFYLILQRVFLPFERFLIDDLDGE